MYGQSGRASGQSGAGRCSFALDGRDGGRVETCSRKRSDKTDYDNLWGAGVKRVLLTIVKRVCYGSVGCAGRVLLAVGLAGVRGALVVLRGGIRAISTHAAEARNWRIDSVRMGSFSRWQRPGGGWVFHVSGSSSWSERVCLVLCESGSERTCRECPWSCMLDGALKSGGGRDGSEGLGSEQTGTEPVSPR